MSSSIDSLSDLPTPLAAIPTSLISATSGLISELSNVDQEAAETMAGPFFGLSLLPYIAYLWLLNAPENKVPKGVIVGQAALLIFVFLSIPAVIAAKAWFGVSMADCDWLHGSAESLLTATNLVTVVAFRQALDAVATEKQKMADGYGPVSLDNVVLPTSATSYVPMSWLMVALTLVAIATAAIPATLGSPSVHEPYLGGFLDLPVWLTNAMGDPPQPVNALSIGCWVVHISSLIEFLAFMECCWRWGDLTQNSRWKGLVWGLLPLHTSGITACTYHFFYNQLPILVTLQSILTCVGNMTAAYAAWRLAASNGWQLNLSFLRPEQQPTLVRLPSPVPVMDATMSSNLQVVPIAEYKPLIGTESMELAPFDTSVYSYLIKLFAGCLVAAYVIKYGETFVPFQFDKDLTSALSFILIAASLNAFKWYQRSQDPLFDGWF